MKFKLIIFFAILLVSFNGFTNNLCGPVITPLSIWKSVERLINQKFSDLKDINFEVKVFQSEDYFFKLQVAHKVRKAENRLYRLKINQNVFNCPPPSDGLEAILVHELIHLNEMHQKAITEISADNSKYLGQKKKFYYERQTDLKTIDLGYIESLANYRKWLYTRLTDRQLRVQKCEYLNPDEIFSYATSKDNKIAIPDENCLN